jgi:trk system potassium uptake protein TrkA
MMKSILVIGMNHFGSLLAKKLHELGHEVMAVDIVESRINDILPFVTDARIGDSTNEAFLRSLGVKSYDVCIVTIGGDFQSSLETTSLLKEIGAKLVVSRADQEAQEKFLMRNGADEVLNPEKQIAHWAAIRYASDHILDYVKLDESHAIIEVDIPEKWLGKTVGELDIRKRYGINLLAVKDKDWLDLSITPDTVLNPGRTMLVLGELPSLQKCFHI